MAADWNSIFSLSEQLGEKLLSDHKRLTTAESCTGGGIGYAITQIPGSSQWYQGGTVAYSNSAKTEQLGVDSQLIDTFGAVSEEVVEAMAVGAASRFHSEIALSTSGVAGPEGGTAEKPVGMVCFGWFVDGDVHSETVNYSGGRKSVRLQSVEHALRGLLKLL